MSCGRHREGKRRTRLPGPIGGQAARASPPAGALRALRCLRRLCKAVLRNWLSRSSRNAAHAPSARSTAAFSLEPGVGGPPLSCAKLWRAPRPCRARRGSSLNLSVCLRCQASANVLLATRPRPTSPIMASACEGGQHRSALGPCAAGSCWRSPGTVAAAHCCWCRGIVRPARISAVGRRPPFPPHVTRPLPRRPCRGVLRVLGGAVVQPCGVAGGGFHARSSCGPPCSGHAHLTKRADAAPRRRWPPGPVPSPQSTLSHRPSAPQPLCPRRQRVGAPHGRRSPSHRHHGGSREAPYPPERGVPLGHQRGVL